MLRYVLSFFLCLLLSVPVLAADEKAVKADAAPPAPASAQPASSPKEPDISSVLFMQNLKNIGAKIFYLGEQLGLHGWFVVKDKQVQILYTTPDNKALLVGALLSAEGANISQQQVLTLASGNPEVQALIKDTPTPMEAAKLEKEEAENPKKPEQPQVPPSEQFYGELQKANGLVFGKENAPLLIMIMDVHCPYCHKAWKKFEPLVEGGRLKVMMVPITAIGPQSETEAAIWLGKKDPYDAWKKHVAGDDKILKVGEPIPAKREAVQNSTDLVKKWGVDQTPYILYRGKGGKVRLVVGLPQDVNAIMTDIAP